MRWTVLARFATAVAGCLLIAGGLTANSGEDGAAQQAAEAYIGLIATGDEGGLAGLAGLIVTD